MAQIHEIFMIVIKSFLPLGNCNAPVIKKSLSGKNAIVLFLTTLNKGVGFLTISGAASVGN